MTGMRKGVFQLVIDQRSLFLPNWKMSADYTEEIKLCDAFLSMMFL
jgi:hypothetical protein